MLNQKYIPDYEKHSGIKITDSHEGGKYLTLIANKYFASRRCQKETDYLYL